MLIQLEDKFRKASELHRKGLLESARLVCEEILADQAIHFDALNLLGLIAAQTQNPLQATTLLSQAISVDPSNPFTHCNLGTALQEIGHWEASLASYDRAVALKPDYAVAHSNRGNVLRRLRRLHEALASYERAIEIQPNFVEAYSNLGNVQGELRLWELALASHDKALALRPEFAEAHCHRGIALNALRRPAEALASFDRAIAIWPGYTDAYVNRGNVLGQLQEFEAATSAYNRAIAIQKDFAPAHVNRALVHLLRGNFERGWSDYHWRWRDPATEATRKARQFTQPLWDGRQNVVGKTILLHDEQGLGDTLQFSRYAKLVAERGATVILGVQKPLIGVLRGLPGVTHLVTDGLPIPHFDFHSPLMNLPLAFDTRLETIPAPAAYLRADAARAAQWRQRFAADTKPRIGLVWSGNANHPHDQSRSIPLATLLEALPDNCRYISLQKELRPGDETLLRTRPLIANVAGELHDFTDTAALCEGLDLVLSVDTSVAHLSGALGKKVWLLLPFTPDWRWLLRRDDSPWYPTMKLYRQTRAGDWREPLTRVRADLLKAFGNQA